MIGAYLAKMGYDYDVVEMATIAPPDSMYWLDENDTTEARISVTWYQ